MMPNLIDAARIAVGEMLMSMGEPYCYSAEQATRLQSAFLNALGPTEDWGEFGFVDKIQEAAVRCAARIAELESKAKP